MPRAGAVLFDEDRADRAVRFFEGVLHHTKGVYARKPFLLTGWQRDEIIRPLFGTVIYDPQFEDWVRRYRLLWLELARKNGKSEILAGIALCLMVVDDEEGAEVYGAARDRDQAGIVFRVAKRMVEMSPLLSRRLRVIESNKRIIDPRTDSFYRVIPADATGELGQDPHGIIFDEVIAQRSRDFWDALRTGQGSRRQPLMVAATTAGNDPASFAAAEHKFSERVAKNPDLDPTRLVVMRNTPTKRRVRGKDVDVDWRAEKNWYFANPALGDFLSLETLRNEAREAENNPASENAFRQFRLNQWVQQTTRWVPLPIWDATAGTIDETNLKGRDAYGGIDLASSIDIAALCWDFPQELDPEKERQRRRPKSVEDLELDTERHEAVWRFWIPEAQLADLNQRTGGQANVWVRERWLTVTEGDVIDYKAILQTIDADASRFNVQEIAYDPWGMTQLSQMLDDLGMKIVPMRQGYATMSPPTKEWERLIRKKLYTHGGNPVMRWMLDNVAVSRDPADNIKIDKKKSGDRVDGAVAAVMALDRATRRERRQKQAHIF